MTTSRIHSKPAVFLDRDGTLIEHVHYLTDPEEVKLAWGAGAALRLLHEHGFACVIVTNQSAIERGMLTEDRLLQIHDVLEELLAIENTGLEGIYFCPIAPSKEREGDRLAIEHRDRKPGPGMLLRAATELDLDLKHSYMVGDMLSDLYAGRNAGVRGSILIEGQLSQEDLDEHQDAFDFRTKSLLEAAEWICDQVNVEYEIDDKAEKRVRKDLKIDESEGNIPITNQEGEVKR